MREEGDRRGVFIVCYGGVAMMTVPNMRFYSRRGE